MLKPLFPHVAPPEESVCSRREARVNLFVLARLEAGGIANEVRVRDISRNGALLQGVALPPKGSRCVLERGDVRVQGQIVWVAGGKAGIRFEGQADVSAWINRGKSELQPAPMDVTHLNAPEPLPGTAIAPPPLGSAISLDRLASALKRAEEKLAGDPAVANVHQDSLRVLSAIAHALYARSN